MCNVHPIAVMSSAIYKYMYTIQVSYSFELQYNYLSYVTLHDKTSHIAHKTIFELRPPLPITTFEPLQFEVSGPYICGDISQNVHGLPVLKFYSKRNDPLLRTLQVKVRILAVYGNTWRRPLSQ